MLAIFLSGLISSAEPPPEYVYPPTNLEVQEMSHSELQDVCASGVKGVVLKPGEYIVIGACTWPLADGCIIAWNKAKPRKGTMWDHEIAHCNGWRH